MPKKINSYKDLSIEWQGENNNFRLDLRPIGGARPNFDTKAEAKQKAREMFEVFSTGMPPTETEPWTVEKASEEYLAHAKRRTLDPDSGYGPRSLVSQRNHLKKIAALKVYGLILAQKKIADIDVDYIEEALWPVLKKSCRSSVTASNRFTCFRQMMFWCVKKKQHHSNPCSRADITVPNRKEIWARKTEQEVARVSPANLQRILDHVLPQHKLKVLFAAETGLRLNEQVALKIYDPNYPLIGGIEFKKNIVHVKQALKMAEKFEDNYIAGPKSKAGIRQVPITPELSQMLKEYYMALPKKMKTEGWLFPSSHGTIADGRNWRRYLHDACEKAGLPRDQWPTWHSLRHAYCTSYLNKRGGNFDRAKELMGHSCYQTTLIYKHFVEDPERDREDAKAVQSGLNLDINCTPPEAPDDNRVVPLRKKAS